MQNILHTILMFGFIICCTEDNNIKLIADLEKPNAMNVYCKRSPNDTLRRIEYVYKNNNLINETTLIKGIINSKITYKYNTTNLLTQEIYESDWRKTDKTYEYNELRQLIKIIYKTFDFDINGQTVNESIYEAPLEYKNNQLIKEWICYGAWAGFNTYEYKNGKVSIKINYTKNGLKHHIIRYKYTGDLLIEEIKETAAGNVMYIKTFHYDSENRLITIIEDENIIEENFYDGEKLIEKRTYYYGPDPGFDVCYGNYIYRYEY
jgi:hypothetical protein